MTTEQARIFIVEDEALILMEIKDRLETLGYAICGTAARGEDAVHKIAEAMPDLVLMDIRLAGKWDGIETVEKIRPVTDVPVVYVTAFSDETLIRRATRSEPFGYILKPFNDRELHATIGMALYRSRTERRLREMNGKLGAAVELLQRQHDDILRLHTMGEALQACGSAEEAYREIKRSLHALFPELPGFVAVSAGTADVMEVKVNWGDLAVKNHFAAGDCPTVSTGVMDLRGTGHSCAVCSTGGASAPRAYLCIPLKAQGRVLGLLHLSHPGNQSAPGSATVQLARAAADTIALALANVALRERLSEQAIRDPLTGLHNRRYLEDTLRSQVAQSTRSGTSVGVLMLDLDHFKRFNDTHGHAAGDRLLEEFGNYLRLNVRHGDYVCRYGGEEFVVVLPDSPIEATRRRAEELRRGTPAVNFEYLGKRLGGVTVSIGIAQFPEDGGTTDLLMRRADQALYRAKAGGRNRVEYAGHGEAVL